MGVVVYSRVRHLPAVWTLQLAVCPITCLGLFVNTCASCVNGAFMSWDHVTGTLLRLVTSTKRAKTERKMGRRNKERKRKRWETITPKKRCPLIGCFIIMNAMFHWLQDRRDGSTWEVQDTGRKTAKSQPGSPEEKKRENQTNQTTRTDDLSNPY